MMCDEYDIPPGGEAILYLEEGRHPSSIDVCDEHITIWNGGPEPREVEINQEQYYTKPAVRDIN